MSTEWCRSFGAAPWECRYFSLSPVLFVGAQASRVSVYLSALTFLSVVFVDFFALLLFCVLDKAEVFVGSSVVVPPVFPFFSPCLPCPFVFVFVFFLSFLLLHLLRVHSCWGFVYIGLFCWFPFLFLEGFFSFLNFILCTGCQGVKMYFRVLWSVWIYSL